MNQLKPIFLLFLFITSLTFNACKEKHPNAQIINETSIGHLVDSIVNPFVKDSLIAGTVIGIAQKGKIKFIKSYGFSNLENKAPILKNAVFPVASVTKTFTAIATMQLVEKGLINLDNKIQKYIDFDTKEKQVTIRQLLNHTSGIKDFTESDIPTKLEENGFSSEKFLQLLEEKEFDFTPNNAMDYNNSGYFLLALIIEKVSGLTYEEYLNKNIFNPSNMQNTANCYSSSIDSKIVNGYNMDREGNLNYTTLGNFQMAKGAGSLCSTVEDLLNWQIALHHSKVLLSKDGYDLMVNRSKLLNGSETNYGLGLEINLYNGNKVLSHNGVIEGYLSDTRYFPENDLTIVTLINTLGKVKPTNVSNTISDFFIEEKNIVQPFQESLSGFIGIYKGMVMGNSIIMGVLEENGQLILESRGNKTLIQYIGNNTWLAEDGYSYSFMEKKMQVNTPKLSIIFEKIE